MRPGRRKKIKKTEKTYKFLTRIKVINGLNAFETHAHRLFARFCTGLVIILHD